MPNCPICNTPGAYVGFSSVECRNPDCAHYEPKMEALCPCCGIAGHRPEYESTQSISVDSFDPSIPAIGGSGMGGPAFNSEPSSYSSDPAGYGADPSQYNSDGTPVMSSAPQGDASGYLGNGGSSGPDSAS